MERALRAWKVTRPLQAALAFFGTWGMTVLSNGPNLLSANKIAAGCVMGLGVLGAIIFHFGGANSMYERKGWDHIARQRRALYMILGGSFMCGSVVVAQAYLTLPCVLLTAFDAVAIILYTRILCRWWGTKNFTIAIVCTTPLLLGWMAGSHTPPLIPQFCTVLFVVHWAREVMKDVIDRVANHGIRLTLPLQFGVLPTLRVVSVAMGAGCILTVSMIPSFAGCTIASIGMVGTACIFGGIAIVLSKARVLQVSPFVVTAGVWLLVASGVLWKFGI